MSEVEEASQPRKLLTLNWTTLLSLFTAFIAAGTVTLHLIGDVSHRQYLRHWGIDPGLFPKTADWILINGYYGVVERGIVSLVAILNNLHWLAVAAVVLGVYIFVLLTPIGSGSGKAPAWLLRQPEWRRRFIRQMLLTALFVFVFPCALLLLTAFMAIPAAIGETAGKAAASKMASEFKKGCQASRVSCVELKREGGVISMGFVLDSSPSYLAIFDADLQRSRVIALEKLEVVSNRVPKQEEGGAP